MNSAADKFHVVYLGSFARRAYYFNNAASLESAMTALRMLRRHGRTVWIETADGVFFPVRGAMRKPAEQP